MTAATEERGGRGALRERLSEVVSQLAAAGAALPRQRGAAVSAKLLVGRDHRATMGAYHTIALLLFEPRRGSLRIGLRSKKITA